MIKKWAREHATTSKVKSTFVHTESQAILPLSITVLCNFDELEFQLSLQVDMSKVLMDPREYG